MKGNWATLATWFWLATACILHGQGTFQNLAFENTTLTVFVRNPSIPSYATNATVPGWDWSPHFTFGFGDPNTTVAFNSYALDAPAVTLQGTNGFVPAILGNHSILLQGGTTAGGMVYGLTNGASVFQTGQFPTNSQSLTYFGGPAIQVAINGQQLPKFPIFTGSSFTVWVVDISAYAGQTGQLSFTAPWRTSGILDGISFSKVPIPEPSTFSLFVLSAVLLGWQLRHGMFAKTE